MIQFKNLIKGQLFVFKGRSKRYLFLGLQGVYANYQCKDTNRIYREKMIKPLSLKTVEVVAITKALSKYNQINDVFKHPEHNLIFSKTKGINQILKELEPPTQSDLIQIAYRSAQKNNWSNTQLEKIINKIKNI